MSIAQSFLHEFEHESKTTRRFLEALPDDKLDWKPHAKSLSAGQLAFHIAASQKGIIEMTKASEVPAPDFSKPFPQPASKKEILTALDDSIAAVKKILPTISDGEMGQTWKMVKDGVPVFEIPRSAAVRTILLNHIYHHRGQFGVYLRLVGAKVPSAYGPSGDEAPQMATAAAK